MATQKDVAKLAGVSVSAVSRVLNESSLLDRETKKNVELAIKKLNYKPNLVAYGLRAKSSRLIGIILQPVFDGQNVSAMLKEYHGLIWLQFFQQPDRSRRM